MARRMRSTLAAVQASGTAALAAALASPTKANHLGDVAWWVPVAGWRRPVADVEHAFALAGFPAGTLHATPDWSDAFGRAIEACKPAAKKAGWLVEDIGDGPNGERRVAIARAMRNGTLSVGAHDQGAVTCARGGHTPPYVETADPNGIGARIIAEAYGLHGYYTSDHVRSVVVDTIGRYAGLMCKAGVYWVPAAGSAPVQALGALLESIGWGRVSQFAGYSDDAQSVKAAVSTVNDGLESQLALFSANVATFGKTTRASTIEAKLCEAKALREQGALYRTILGAAVESVDDRINAIEQALRDALGIVDSAKGSQVRA